MSQKTYNLYCCGPYLLVEEESWNPGAAKLVIYNVPYGYLIVKCSKSDSVDLDGTAEIEIVGVYKDVNDCYSARAKLQRADSRYVYRLAGI